MLANRFRIIRPLGHGGMGEVYEAEDLELHEPVALKTLLPEIAGDEQSLERFRREVLLARKVTHPNVCRINDVFRHTIAPSAEGAAPGAVLFLSMELLKGRTLADFLKSSPSGARRRLNVKEAFPLAQQMGAALEAAHKAGIVHRDFKCGNVMLVPQSGNTAPRVVVTDFGLARFASQEGAASLRSTKPGDFVGTPAYVAPEQVEGGKITAATDVYAFGIVLYEMVTGKLPFVGDTPIATALMRLTEKPAPPKELNPELDVTWNAVILKCLARYPEDRFHSMQEVLQSFAGDQTAFDRLTREQIRKRKTRLAATAAVLFLGAASYGTYRVLRERGFDFTGAPVEKPFVALVRLENSLKKPEKNWIGTSLEETLRRQLVPGNKLQVISGEDVARMRNESVLPEGNLFDNATLDKIRTNLGADQVIAGGYESLGDQSGGQVRVTLNVQDAVHHTALPAIQATGKEDDLFGLSDQLGHSLRVVLKAGDITTADVNEIRSTVLANSLANRSYAEGLDMLRSFDPLGATRSLQDAVKADPQAPLPHAALSEAWSVLGYDKKALAEAKAAQSLSSDLRQADKLAIDCRAMQLERSNWQNAIRACKAVWDLSFGLRPGLQLADVQFEAEKWRDALGTLDSVRKNLNAPEKDDPQIDLKEAINRAALTEFPQQQEAAKRATDKAKQRGAKLLEAAGHLWSCIAFQNLNKFEEAQAACQDADSLYLGVGDNIGQARTATQLAHILSNLDHHKESEDKYREALKLATKVGSMRDRCDALLNYGDSLSERKEFVRAIEKYQQSIAVAEQSDNALCKARATENLGLIAKAQHQYKDAQKDFQKAASAYRQLNVSADAARVLSNLGSLYWMQGQLAEAKPLLEEAARRRAELGLKDAEAFSDSTLGDLLLAQDHPEEAAQQYNRAFTNRNDLKELADANESKIRYAAALVEQGKAQEAAATAKEMAAWYSSGENKDPDYEMFARDVLIRALLAQGKKNETVEEANHINTLLPKAEEENLKISAQITLARVAAATGQPDEAVSSLQKVIEETSQKGLLQLRLEAQLALASVNASRSDPDAAAQLRDLGKVSRSRGYFLISRKAAGLARGLRTPGSTPHDPT